MRTIETTVYKFDELDEDAKDRAVEKLYDLNIDHEWWDFILDEAEKLGLEIKEFDTDRYHIKGHLTDTPQFTIDCILADHGESCDTFKLAKEYKEGFDALPCQEMIFDECDHEPNCETEYDDLRENFEHALLQEYLTILRHEFEYLTSREQIEESIRVNEYEFTEEGELI